MSRLRTTNATKVLSALIWTLIAATTAHNGSAIEVLTGAAALALLIILATWEVQKRLHHGKPEPAPASRHLLLPNVTLAGLLGVLVLIEFASPAGKTG